MASYAYDPYGVQRSGSGNAFGYQTEQKDAESGLTYLRARYYDPTIGRFTAKDPFSGFITDPTGQNGYNYANNNPVNLMDHDGEFAWPGAIIGSVIGAGFGALEVHATNPNATAKDYFWGTVKGAAGGAAAGFSGAYVPIIAGSLAVGSISAVEDMYSNRSVDMGGVARDIVSNVGGGVAAAPYQLVKTSSRLGRYMLETNGALISNAVGFTMSAGLNNYSNGYTVPMGNYSPSSSNYSVPMGNYTPPAYNYSVPMNSVSSYAPTGRGGGFCN